MLGLLLAPPAEESSKTRDERVMTLGIAAALACGLIGGMIMALDDMAMRPDRQEAIRFSRTIYQSIGPEKHAIDDVIALKLYPTTPEGRIAAAAHIHGELVPVWERLYDSIKAAEVPLDSPNWKNRHSLLTYYGNTQKLLELTANTIDARKLDDTMSKTFIPALMQEVRLEQLALIQHKRCELNARLCPGNPRSSANQTP